MFRTHLLLGHFFDCHPFAFENADGGEHLSGWQRCTASNRRPARSHTELLQREILRNKQQHSIRETAVKKKRKMMSEQYIFLLIIIIIFSVQIFVLLWLQGFFFYVCWYQYSIWRNTMPPVGDKIYSGWILYAIGIEHEPYEFHKKMLHLFFIVFSHMSCVHFECKIFQ